MSPPYPSSLVVETGQHVAFLDTILSVCADHVYVLDRDGHYLYVSPSAAQDWELSAKRVLGRTGRDLDLPGDSMQVLDRGREQALRIGRPVTVEVSFDVAGATHFYESVISPVTGPSGDVELVVVNSWDITERKQRENELRASEDRFRGLLEAAPDGIVLVDAEGRITLANDQIEALFGHPRESIVGQSVEVLIPSRFRADHLDHREAYRSHPTIRRMGSGMELFGLHADGHEFPVEVSLSPLDSRGQGFTIAAVRDISERKRADEEIRSLNDSLNRRVAELTAVNEELESFSYSVSHDLRAPLRSIDGFSQALLEDYADVLDETGENYLQRLRAASQRMGALIDDLLKLSRITRSEAHVEDVDLAAIAQEVVTDLRAEERRRDVTVHIEQPLPARGDRALLRVVLQNLIGNAWKFSSHRTEPVIRMGRRATEKGTCFYVEDNGAGFDMKYLDRLFGPFQRLHRMDEFDGNGIGLATVQRVIRRHGGQIWATGEEDRGACFCFTLPGSPEPERG
ncbi:MAG: PAS domain S-box protein [Gammaproteobacteria bacterium]